MAANSDLEARVMAIAEELRCLVCQNETIAASQADLAKDLRQQIREQLTQGRTQPQILEFMSQRYGDFVLYRPPLNANTALLWFGPALLLVGGVATLWLILYRRSRMAPEAFEPDEDELLAEQPAPGERAASPASSAKT